MIDHDIEFTLDLQKKKHFRCESDISIDAVVFYILISTQPGDSTPLIYKTLNSDLSTRVVNLFSKRSFLFCFQKRSIRFRKKRSFLKTTHSFWIFRKQIAIVIENDHFYKNDLRPFFIQFFLKKRSFLKNFLLTIMLTKRRTFSKRSFLEKITCNFIECRLTWSFTVVGELKLLDIFL